MTDTCTDTHTNTEHHCTACHHAAYTAGRLEGDRRRRNRNRALLFLVVYLFFLLVLIEAVREKESPL